MVHEINYAVFDNFPEIECKTVWEDNFPESPAESGKEVREHFLRIQNKSGIAPDLMAAAEQVHENRVRLAPEPGIYPECDGLVSDCADLYLLIRTADCAAVMVYDPERKVIANWHAGWRGVKSEIIIEGINLLKQQLGCRPENLRVAVSPFIHACCYRVGAEFRRYFSGPYLHIREDGIYMDLKLAISDQLLSKGVLPEHLEVSDHCTYCSAHHLPSYRRTGTKNRLLNVIKIKEV